MDPLEIGTGPIRGAYLPPTVENVLWGRLPCAADEPVLRVEPGDEVTLDTLSHEGILEDQGRDPDGFFAAYDVPVLADARALAASEAPHVVDVDGPELAAAVREAADAWTGDPATVDDVLAAETWARAHAREKAGT